MRSKRVLQSVLAASACACALAFAVGCAPAASSSAANSASASTAASSATSASSAAATSSTAASSTAAQSGTAASAASQQASSAASAGALTEETAAAQGYQVFKGTVHVADAAGIIKLQGVDLDPSMVAPTKGGTFAILVFDKETQVTGESADGSGQRTQASHALGIAEHSDWGSFVTEYGDLDACKALDGQQVTVAAKAENIMFPSDVRLPINEPSAKNIVIL